MNTIKFHTVHLDDDVKTKALMDMYFGLLDHVDVMIAVADYEKNHAISDAKVKYADECMELLGKIKTGLNDDFRDLRISLLKSEVKEEL